MLKDRVKKWDQEKKVKPCEMEAIIRRLTIRESAHKRSEVRVRGKPVSMVKVTRYRKRNRMSLEIAHIRSPTPPGVEVYTPLASPPSTPRSLELPDLVVKHIREYVLGVFEAKVWVSVGDMEEIKFQRKDFNIFDFSILAFDALDPSAELNAQDAEQTIINLDVEMGDIIRFQDDKAINYLFWVMLRFASQGKLNLLKPSVQHFSATAIEALGPSHLIALISSHLGHYITETEDSTIIQLITTTWRSEVDGFNYALGPRHMSTRLHKFVYHQATTPDCDLADDLADMRTMLHECDEDFRSPADIRPIVARLSLARSIASARGGRAQLLTSIATEIIERTQRCGFPPHLVANYRGWAHYYLGVFHMSVGVVNVGEYHFNEAIGLRVMRFGPRDATARQYQDVLERWWRR